ncbi:MAG: stage II sporulation protein M [Deltaproteobacteria bacterium]|nr:MAG: stage II sporulation protein M [Deltaproteobacteria bacterium]
MSDRETFVQARRERWQALEALLSTVRLSEPSDWSEFARLYRSVCADLARAQALDLPEDVLRYLDRLASRAHNRLYRPPRGLGAAFLRTLFLEVPRAVRAEWRFVLLAHVLLYLPFLFGLIAAWWEPDFATKVLPESVLAEMEEGYAQSVIRTEGQNTMMAGFYVWNNVGIAFRCFVTGAFAGLGSIFYLVYNGLMLGTISGFLFAQGMGGNLTAFTASHTPWELTGIALAGAAGLKLGYALFVPEGRTRRASLARAAGALYRLVLGATLLLLIAALIEGYWSASTVSASIKYVFSGVGFVVVGGWLLWIGRGGAE